MLDDEEEEEGSFDDDGEQRGNSRRTQDDSSEEEEDEEDEEEAQRVREGFIVDEDDEEEEDIDTAEARRRKRKRRREREEPEQLDEDDLDLIGETMEDWGRSSKNKSGGRLLKRLKQGHSRDHDRGERHTLEEIFEDDDDYGNEERAYARGNHRMQDGDLDDFIEDDYPEDDEERRQHEADLEVARPTGHRGRTIGIDVTGLDPEALEDMQAVFGDGTDYDWALDMEETQEAEREDQTAVELKDVFEPSQLAEKMLTDADNEIRWKDEPERFQLERKPFEHITIDDAQFKEEVRWIYQLIWPRKGLPSDVQHAFSQAIRRVLEFVVVDSMEVPYIFQHKKDYLIYVRKDEKDETIGTEKLLNQSDLWRIIELDIKFKGFIEKRNTLERNYTAIKALTGQDDQVLEDLTYKAENMEELQDLQDYINFRYAKELRDISFSSNTKETKRPGAKTTQWLKIRESNAYNFVKAYGLSATQLGMNALANGPRSSPEDEQKLPDDLADTLVDDFFETGDSVMQAGRQMFSEELVTDPMMRKYMRQLYYAYATISSRRTEKGLRKIDEAHPYYEIKYLINQSIPDMARRPELFLKMAKAEEEGLIEIRVELSDAEQFIKKLTDNFKSENFHEMAEAWNEERANVVELAFPKLSRLIAKGVKDSLRTACQDDILLACRTEYSKRLDQAPYKPSGLVAGTTPRILAFSNGMGDPTRDPIYWTSVEEDGKLLEHGTFNSLGRDPAQRDQFVNLILRKGPDALAVSGYSANTNRLIIEIKSILEEKRLMSNEYEDDNGVRRADPLEVVVVNDEVARLYKDSPRGTADFPTLNPVVRYCFALCRYMQNPLKEYAALGKDIITLKFHPCQHLVPQQKLSKILETSMVDMVNLVGVDINEAVSDPYTANLLPYVSGLGPRKAVHIVKLINANGGSISSREELVGDIDSGKPLIVGPRIFNNCASFLYIEYDPTNRESDPLDNTRVHPEDYELGRKMAADALELYDEDVKVETDEHGPAAIVRMLFRNEEQEKVNDLVLEEYAEQLERKFQQRKRATLETIRAELLMPYEELRRPYAALDPDDIFQMFTGETKESFQVNSIVPAVVRQVKDDYAQLKLDNGLDARVGSHEVAHRHSIKEVLHIGQTIRGVLIKLDRKNFMVDMSLREEQIRRAEIALRGNRSYNAWDAAREDKDRESMQIKDQSTGRAQRVIKHPLFHLFGKTQAEEYLGSLANGEAIIRPSSRGNDHITITWKVANGVFQHLDVLELEKENEFSVGKKLRVGNQIYSDLDELIVEHVKAMGKKVAEMMRNDKWHEGSKSAVEDWLNSYCAANPHRSNYRFCIDPKHPGYFFLLFKASKNAQTSYWMVRVIPQGYEMQKNKYPDMKALCNGFKLMFQAEATKQMTSRPRQSHHPGHHPQTYSSRR